MVPKCPRGCDGWTYDQGSFSTLLTGASFWEDGVYHYHDRNQVTRRYQCGECKGRWEFVTRTRCPSPDCSWNDGVDAFEREHNQNVEVV